LLEPFDFNGSPCRSVPHSSRNRYKDALTFLPKFIKILNRESDQEKSQILNENEGERSQDVLTVLLSEDNFNRSSPKRIAVLMEGISLLYEVVSQVEQVEKEEIEDSELIVLGCDSGSDKAFDFLGLAEVIGSLKDLILELWDRIIFYKEKKLSAKMELIANSLPIHERISVLQSSNLVPPETAEILRRNLNMGISSFLECGAIIPEMDHRSVFSPRQLMSPDRKLLTPVSNDIEDRVDPGNQLGNEEISSESSRDNVADEANKTNLTAEEIETLQKLLKKASGNKGTHSVDENT